MVLGYNACCSTSFRERFQRHHVSCRTKAKVASAIAFRRRAELPKRLVSGSASICEPGTQNAFTLRAAAETWITATWITATSIWARRSCSCGPKGRRALLHLSHVLL